jgi:hypothetical protein
MNQYHDTTFNFLMFFCELGVLGGDRCDRPLLNQQLQATGRLEVPATGAAGWA